jgi:hypothetical protein
VVETPNQTCLAKMMDGPCTGTIFGKCWTDVHAWVMGPFNHGVSLQSLRYQQQSSTTTNTLCGLHLSLDFLLPNGFFFLDNQIIALDEFQCHEADMKFTEEMPGHVYTILFSK